MTNKEFIDYMVMTGQLNVENKFIKSIVNCPVYLGDRFLKITKISKLNGDTTLVGFDSCIEKIKPDELKECLDLNIKLLKNYSYYIGDNIEKFYTSIIRDFIFLDTIDKEYFINKSVIIGPKRIRVGDKFESINNKSVVTETVERKFKWLMDLPNEKDIDFIIYKDKHMKLIRVNGDDQIEELRKVIKQEEYFDLAVMANYSKSYKDVAGYLRKMLKGSLYE